MAASDPGPALSEADMVECGVCGRLFQTAQGLKTHTTRTHGKKVWSNGRSQVERALTNDTGPLVEDTPPVDQGRVTLDEQVAAEQGILDMIEGVEYEQARDAFMPVLAVEAAKRLADGDHRLAGVYFIFYLDAKN
jgi:hypothetical protein